MKRVSGGDHSAIQAAKPVHHTTQGRFWLFVAVAPTRAPKQLQRGDFGSWAKRLASLVLPEPFELDYFDGDLARFLVPALDTPSLAMHILDVHRSGLVDLRWGLDMPVVDGAAELPLAEVMTVLHRVLDVARQDAFRALCKKRWAGSRRRLDWRVGLAPHVSDQGGQVPWSKIVFPGREPEFRAANRWTPCPPEGYGAERLRSVRPNVKPQAVIEPVLRDLLAVAGYLGVDDCVSDVLAMPPSAPPAAALPGSGDSHSELGK
ncbi:hypothetical protein [Umezawaea tangerina]|uniref:hypothetical protein n=1 Tax=Umezawaea tangerina TaxID=84725 RepID=UPI0011B2571E|nr:hypothetical protein [Umezawaea tangerina]